MRDVEVGDICHFPFVIFICYLLLDWIATINFG
jgi:hypothetical protein